MASSAYGSSSIASVIDKQQLLSSTIYLATCMLILQVVGNISAMSEQASRPPPPDPPLMSPSQSPGSDPSSSSDNNNNSNNISNNNSIDGSNDDDNSTNTGPSSVQGIDGQTPTSNNLIPPYHDSLLSPQLKRKLAIIGLLLLSAAKLYLDFFILFPSHTGSNWYSILGIGRFASDEEIRQGYKKMALVHHPDRSSMTSSLSSSPPSSPSSAVDMFLKIKSTHDYLLNPKFRHSYNRYGLGVTEDYMSSIRAMKSSGDDLETILFEKLQFRVMIASIWLLVTWAVMVTTFTSPDCHKKARTAIWAVLIGVSTVLYGSMLTDITIPLILNRLGLHFSFAKALTEFELGFILQSMLPILMCTFSFRACSNYKLVNIVNLLAEFIGLQRPLDRDLQILQQIADKTLEIGPSSSAEMSGRLVNKINHIGMRLQVNIEAGTQVARILSKDIPSNADSIQYLFIMAFYCAFLYYVFI